MEPTLRLYANPLKLVFYLVLSLMFVAVGVLILLAASSSAHGINAITTYALAFADLGFFGLGVVVFLIVLLRNIVLRRPILSVDASGWRFSPEIGVKTQTANWSDVGRVAVYQQQLPRHRAYHLVLEARQHAQLPASRIRSISARMYPTMAKSLMVIPLNTVFIRTTPARAEDLLHDIHARFANEIQDYGITITDTVELM